MQIASIICHVMSQTQEEPITDLTELLSCASQMSRQSMTSPTLTQVDKGSASTDLQE